MKMRFVASILTVVVLLAGVASLEAASNVKLEIMSSARGSSLVYQQWLRSLSDAGIKNVRIGSARSTDKIAIVNRGSDSSPYYIVTAELNAKDELVVPGAKFKRTQAAKLAEWIDDLAEKGPVEDRPKVGAFGMTQDEFDRVKKDLATPIISTTEDVARDEVIKQIAGRLSLRLDIDRQQLDALAKDKVAEELSGLSCGTGLTCVLRPMGLCLVPSPTGYKVVEAKAGLEIWPIGFKPEKSSKEVLPALFEFLTVNIQGVSAEKALTAIAARIEVPVLMDHNALARHGIEPEKVIVKLPPGRTSYGIALRKILFQAGLKSELRVDESGKPFLWVTTIKPI